MFLINIIEYLLITTIVFIQSIHPSLVCVSTKPYITVEVYANFTTMEAKVIGRSDQLEVKLMSFSAVVIKYHLSGTGRLVIISIVQTVPSRVIAIVCRRLPVHTFTYTIHILQTSREGISPCFTHMAMETITTFETILPQ